jgi:hypothetical protein
MNNLEIIPKQCFTYSIFSSSQNSCYPTYLDISTFLPYDFTVDSSLAAADNAQKIVTAWQNRSVQGVFAEAWQAQNSARGVA